jgi:predicted ATP-binding protein involved in virulence
MRIDRLRVKNFRGFSERDFSFHERFNVFIGENATGKTAALEALKVAIGSWFLGIQARHGKAIAEDDVRLKGFTHESTGEQSFEKQYPVEVEATGTLSSDLTDGVLTWSRSIKKEGGNTTQKDARSLTAVAEEADRQVRDGNEVLLPVLAYYGTDRLHHPEPRRENGIEKEDLSRFAGYRKCLDGRINIKHFERWIERQEWIAFQENSAPMMQRIIRESIASLIPDVEKVRYDPRRASVIVIYKDSTVLPLEHLSDGYRTMLALVGDLASRMARLNPHLGEETLTKTPGVVLIDELDLHLHPAWQRRVIADLADTFRQVQFVSTTHSPQIISEVETGNVLVLEQDKSNVQIEEENAYGLDSNWVLEHIMKVSPRPEKIERLIEKVEDALAQEEYDRARKYLDEARTEAKRTSGTMTRLQAKIDTLEMISDDEKNSQAGE